MFERRLRFLLFVFVGVTGVLAARLFQLQVLQADTYREKAERVLVAPPRSLPFVRGSILDRTGRVLVQDEPCWKITIDYDMLRADASQEEDPMRRALRRWVFRGRRGTADEFEVAQAALREKLSTMWRDLAALAGSSEHVTEAELRERGREIVSRVARIRELVSRQRGFDAPIGEELTTHPLVSGLDAARQISAREALAAYPWLHVEPAAQRRVVDGQVALAHVLGRMGPVTADDLRGDADRDDPLVAYRSHERRGISGVEWAAENTLRGRRGQASVDRDGELLPEENIEAENGRDVALTVHLDLQTRLYDLLADTVESIPDSSGGAIVVLSVKTREVLALVSYPSFDVTRFNEDYDELDSDTERRPLRFRAVASGYAPGSTIKPLVALAGLMKGAMTPTTREECRGYLFADHRDRWRCWQIHGSQQRKEHGPVDVVEALTGSCNVFMYRLGERLGLDRLCSAFDMVGFGRPTGIGLREEAVGVNPTPSWLMSNTNTRVTPGVARLFAIGQGELTVTPVQLANLMATYANGRYRPLTLIHREEPTPEWIIPASGEFWSAVRRGIYGVVNDPQGTAYDFARFTNADWALVGKTGSATARPWPTSYRIRFPSKGGESHEEHGTIVRAGSKREAIERFSEELPAEMISPADVTVETRWPIGPPPEGDQFAHAWFGGYLQAIDSAGRPIWSRTPKVAFAALVEFGGSGGRTSGPLAKRIAGVLLDTLGPELEVDDEAPLRTHPHEQQVSGPNSDELGASGLPPYQGRIEGGV